MFEKNNNIQYFMPSKLVVFFESKSINFGVKKSQNLINI
jgi:hypothetical protein